MGRHLVISLVILLVPMSAFAQEVPPAHMRFEVVGAESAPEMIDTAIVDATRDLGLLQRTLVRAELRDRIEAPDTVTIVFDRRIVTVEVGGERPMTTPNDGTRIRRVMPDGAMVSFAQFVGPRLVQQSIRRGDVRRDIVFEFGPARHLMFMHITIRHPALTHPVRLTLTYRAM